MNTQIYVHIPFCAAKCHYCAFNSTVAPADLRESYVDALIAEINLREEHQTCHTIYFGGGTPTILKLNQIVTIFHAIQKNFHVATNAEITIEANPGTIDKNFLNGLRTIGFNRLSIGVQSFDNKLLKILGRIHNSQTAIQTVTTARKIFDSISVDLMYGLPNQTIESVKSDLEIANELKVNHISIYGLEVEPNTKFFQLNSSGQLHLPSDEVCNNMYDIITKALQEFDYNRYEVSNFAKKGFESRHNSGYWTGAKYFGFGAGAHSYNGKMRTSNIADIDSYVKKIRAGQEVSQVEEIVTTNAAMEEFCFLGLRLVEGINAKTFRARFGKNIFDVYGKVIEKNLRLGTLGINGDKIFLTERGMKVGNIVFADFLIDDA